MAREPGPRPAGAVGGTGALPVSSPARCRTSPGARVPLPPPLPGLGRRRAGAFLSWESRGSSPVPAAPAPPPRPPAPNRTPAGSAGGRGGPAPRGSARASRSLSRLLLPAALPPLRPFRRASWMPRPGRSINPIPGRRPPQRSVRARPGARSRPRWWIPSAPAAPPPGAGRWPRRPPTRARFRVARPGAFCRDVHGRCDTRPPRPPHPPPLPDTLCFPGSRPKAAPLCPRMSPGLRGTLRGSAPFPCSLEGGAAVSEIGRRDGKATAVFSAFVQPR